MPPAARVTDMHTCPMVTVLVPHVGGPIMPPGVPTVLIDFLPAATVTSMLVCVGPPDIIVKGSSGVFINYLPAARMGDMTAHGGVIVLGSPTCMIGEIGSGSPGAGGMGGVTAGLAAAGLSNPIDPNASVYGSAGTPAPPAGGASPAAKTGDPLTPALMADVNKSPTLTKQIADLKAAGWTFKYGTPGAGTYADRSTKTVVIDPNTSDNPTMLTLLSHEVGHAVRPAPAFVPAGSLSKADFVAQNVQGNLQDEADATINNIKVQEELAKNGGPAIGIAGAQGNQYKQLYDSDPATARDKIANLFADGEHPSTDPTSTYRDYYSKPMADYYDKINPGKP
ncbi:MAG: PAAR domain-containing protein [Granulicella sp.]